VKEATLADLSALVAGVARGVAAPARLYLVNRTSHLAERWTDRVSALELAGDESDGPLADAVRREAAERELEVTWESPADIVPLPTGWQSRNRAVSVSPVNRFSAVADLGPVGALDVRHFDPYGAVLRLVARGDEPDYVAALVYLRHGWVELARLEGLIAEMLPDMNLRTIAQDAAEFRRKFKGLRQLCASEAARAEALGFTAAAWA